MRIERDIFNQFKVWKEASDRKPILLRSARQIGKTWAMETFGEECFKYCVKFDFDKQQELKSVFQISKDPERLVKELTLYCDQPLYLDNLRQGQQQSIAYVCGKKSGVLFEYVLPS